MDESKTLVLVDGSALAFRSFYALFTSGMRASDGTPTWAVWGFFKALFDLLEKRRPDMMAVCFDLAAPTFRHKDYQDYKANRAEMPDDLAVQWPVIKEGVEALSIPLYELEGFEADDVIGTVARRAAERGINVVILTGDQDAFQLLDERIQVLMPGRDGLTTYGRDEVYAKLGVWPEQVIDYKGLCGDTSDNIPGVKGIGPKTAVPLLAQYQTIEGIYEHIDEVKGAAQKKLIEGKQSAFASKDLATIRCDVPLDFDFEHCRLTLPDVARVAGFFRARQFNTILKRLPKALAPFNNGIEPDLPQELLEPAARLNVPQQLTVFESAQVDNQGGAVTTAVVSQLSLLPQFVPQFGAPEPTVVRSEEELSALMRDLDRQTILSVDLETTGLASLDCDIVGYALAWTDGARLDSQGRIEVDENEWAVRSAYIPVRHFAESQLDPGLVADKLRPILESAHIGKVAQNGKYEMNVLSLCGIRFGPMAFDPMLASYIVDANQSHGLKDQAERLLGYQMVRITDLIGTGRKQATMDTIPVARVAPYAADDARMALELARYYMGRLDADQRFLLFDMDMPLTAVLARMEQAGVMLDLPYLKQFSSELTVELARLEQEIYALAGHAFNINSPQQLQKVLFEELKLSARAKTKSKSGYSTDASVLKAIAGEHAVVPKILEFRELAKLRSTYVEALPRQLSPRDNRLHGEFNQTGTSTGRLSSSNPNLQNIPIRTELGRRIRRAFIPGGQSRLLLSADYSQIELRLLAHMSGDETLLDAFAKDQDIHARTAMEIFDVPLTDVTSDMRRIGKTINFSLVYQQGAYSTGLDLGISTKEAQSFIDKYFSRYPKVRSFMSETIAEARQTGYVKTLWGRRRYFNNLNDRNEQLRRAEERAACNAPLQGSAADLMKLAMIRLDREISARGLATKLILQVHDELVLEVPESEIDEVKSVVGEAMRLGQPLSVPLKVDMGVAPNWMEVK